MTLHFSIVIEKWRLRQIQMACIFLIHGPCFLPCSPFEAKLNTVREDVIGSALCNASCTKQTAPTPHHHFCSDKKKTTQNTHKNSKMIKMMPGDEVPILFSVTVNMLVICGFPLPCPTHRVIWTG